ncbi:YtxH domain-containing protein [Pedobacter petrophilus]|uniref:YtxH domain-containing protein n=1 Tax=Pedobacter petrophilus TaxID=1908241 RepID=A0A7K0FZP2_9SPHI|nr:YtxH domain-containing protein [Pedobacter petrophilus]MRX77063.1 YtxH domain-containing protein [Pedobacter petrophilus]
MGLSKYIFWGTASVFVLHYLTKKRLSDGKSVIDDIMEKAPKIVKEVNTIKRNIKMDYEQTTGLY